MNTSNRTRGRPRIPDASRKSRRIQFACTPGESEMIRDGAALAQRSLRDWIVDACREKAAEQTKP